jgi:hypothetical protein
MDSTSKEIALILQPLTERLPFADAYGRHCTAEKGIGQSIFEQVQSSRCVNVDFTCTVVFPLLR